MGSDRPSTESGDEIEVTPEMIAAGGRLIADACEMGVVIAEEFARDVFIAVLRAAGDDWRYPPLVGQAP